MTNPISLIPVYIIIGIVGVASAVAGLDAIGLNSYTIGQWLLVFGGIMIVTAITMLYSYRGGGVIS